MGRSVTENTTAGNSSKGNRPTPKGDKEYVNHGMEDQMEVEGYIRSKTKTAIVILFTVLTGGVLRLFLFWFPYLLVKWTHRKCQFGIAKTVILKDEYNQRFVSDVMTAMVDKDYNTLAGSSRYSSYKRSGSNKIPRRRSTDSTPLLFSDDEMQFDVVRYFISKKVKYLLNPETELFEKLRGLEESTSCSFFHNTQGQSRAEQLKGEQSMELIVSMSVSHLLFNYSSNRSDGEKSRSLLLKIENCFRVITQVPLGPSNSNLLFFLTTSV
ncbi:probable cation-transporting ATPase 13A3 [Pecten maximus]|uniref:probable cation-transporting ATPase 13A3 n=1 Tax=Pecten maximus TaxID=6579 RepID=UPI001458ADAD|nr:probable cation-transporting ATPase 13A3 [Pecten maximus]